MDPNWVSVFICTIPLKGSGGAPQDFPRGRCRILGLNVEFNLPVLIRFKLECSILNSIYSSDCPMELTALGKLMRQPQIQAAMKYHFKKKTTLHVLIKVIYG